MLRKVKLYGALGERFGKEWNLDINSVREATKAIAANNPEFRKEFISSHERGIGYHVMVGDEYMTDEEHSSYPTGNKEIKIIPVVIGAKKKGLAMILIGALIIGAAFMTGGLSMTSTLAGSVAEIGSLSMTQSGMMALKFGASLIMSGIGAMLAPTPKPIEQKDEPKNYAFNGPVNTVSQGVAVPVCYGKLVVGGAVISSGIQAEDYNPE